MRFPVTPELAYRRVVDERKANRDACDEPFMRPSLQVQRLGTRRVMANDRKLSGQSSPLLGHRRQDDRCKTLSCCYPRPQEATVCCAITWQQRRGFRRPSRFQRASCLLLPLQWSPWRFRSLA